MYIYYDVYVNVRYAKFYQYILCKVHGTSAPLSSYDANRQSKSFKWQKSWFHYSVWETGPKETGTLRESWYCWKLGTVLQWFPNQWMISIHFGSKVAKIR